tara:strand:- start:417 stop:737 length:321 start_codon:yes stop_codon:yes gene_type:complete
VELAIAKKDYLACGWYPHSIFLEAANIVAVPRHPVAAFSMACENQVRAAIKIGHRGDERLKERVDYPRRAAEEIKGGRYVDLSICSENVLLASPARAAASRRSLPQ